jgi:hypothetical protein
LAQFQQLEQSINSGQDIAGIRADLESLMPATQSANSGGTKAAQNS